MPVLRTAETADTEEAGMSNETADTEKQKVKQH